MPCQHFQTMRVFFLVVLVMSIVLQVIGPKWKNWWTQAGVEAIAPYGAHMSKSLSCGKYEFLCNPSNSCQDVSHIQTHVNLVVVIMKMNISIDWEPWMSVQRLPIQIFRYFCDKWQLWPAGGSKKTPWTSSIFRNYLWTPWMSTEFSGITLKVAVKFQSKGLDWRTFFFGVRFLQRNTAGKATFVFRVQDIEGSHGKT